LACPAPLKGKRRQGLYQYSVQIYTASDAIVDPRPKGPRPPQTIDLQRQEISFTINMFLHRSLFPDLFLEERF
jgi:hypothetical protein